MAEKALPHSLEMLRAFWDKIKVPTEPFNPDGAWVNTYRCQLMTNETVSSWNAASLRIQRSTLPDGIQLNVTQTKPITGPKTNLTHASMECQPDTLTTPRKWQVGSVILDHTSKPMDYTRYNFTGQAEGSVIKLTPGTRKMQLGKRFSSTWSFFDAVQRLPFGGKAIEFDMLEELQKPRRGHKIQYSGSLELTLGGQPTHLHGFVQTGQGIWDGAYFLDDNHRLIIASVGLMEYFYDPQAKLVEEKR